MSEARTKKCRGCGEELPLEDYYPNNYTRCKECEKAFQRERYVADGGHAVWARYVRRTFGIEPEQYQAMLDEQGGVCAICGRTPDEAYPDGRRHAIDHDHDTGKIRGILCGHCNQALGQMDDDPDRMFAAAKYLIMNGS